MRLHWADTVASNFMVSNSDTYTNNDSNSNYCVYTTATWSSVSVENFGLWSTRIFGSLRMLINHQNIGNSVARMGHCCILATPTCDFFLHHANTDEKLIKLSLVTESAVLSTADTSCISSFAAKKAYLNRGHHHRVTWDYSQQIIALYCLRILLVRNSARFNLNY